MNGTDDEQQPPLTRRELRAREAAPDTHARRRATPEPKSIIAPSQLAPIDPPVEAVVGFRRRAVPQPKKTFAHRRASLRAGRAVRSTQTSPRRRSSLASMVASFGAMITVGALLVGSSLPINVLSPVPIELAASGAVTGAVVGQTLRVSADAVEGLPVRDNFDVVSPAEMLALKFSGLDYGYTLTSGAVRWPLSSAIPITDGFGPRNGGFHKGVDFVPGEGAPIYAIADGVAVTAGYDNSGYGNHVVIQHNLGGVDVKSNYAHMILDSSPIVPGQQIKVGDFLGLVGDTGIAYGAHLHFEIYVDDVPVDPYTWLQANASN